MKFIKKGFTLIELLVTIGILAVVAAGVIALINPQEKTRQAQDANAQSAIGQVATALQSYSAQRPAGDYPLTAVWGGWGVGNILVTSGELVAMPNLPVLYTTNYVGTATAATVGVRLLSAKYLVQCTIAGEVPYWFWDNSNGRACGFCGSAVPDNASTCNTTF